MNRIRRSRASEGAGPIEGTRTASPRRASRTCRLAWPIAASLLVAFAGTCPLVRAQGPEFDVGEPPGAAEGASTLGQPLGAADFPDFKPPTIAPFTGRAGPGGSRAPAAAMSPPGVPTFRTTRRAQFAVRPIPESNVPAYGDLDLPEEMEGPPDGMTLDAAIERLIEQNLDLQAFRLEIPMADADLLTAGLRANPIFYADTQLIPYGHFSFLRPGGPMQSDINITYPFDVTFKRKARQASARAARKVTEAQLQGAIRDLIDNLYTVYVDVAAAGLTVKFSKTYAKGTRDLLQRTQRLFDRGEIREADVLAVRIKLEVAELQVREADQAKIKTNRALAVLLNLPLDQVESLHVLDPIGQVRALPLPRERMVEQALRDRPDLRAFELGVARANADVRLARANSYPDVYVLYQPYTFQNNTYLGVSSAYSWTLGVTATVPLYNRNQGNIARAKINVSQSELQSASRRRQVVGEVLDAVQELEQSRLSVIEFRNEILPASAKMRNAARRLYLTGQYSVLDYLEAQLSYNDVVKQYRDALVRHRRATLDLNTAVGSRVLP